jgi:hypothetical protein
MRTLEDGLNGSSGDVTVGSAGLLASTLIDRLEAGETPAQVISDACLQPGDLLGAIAHDALGDHLSLGPALDQARPLRPKLKTAISEPAWAAVFPSASRAERLCLAAGLLQIHDFWDPSHDAAQLAEDLGDRDLSAYWHGIAHRRELDPGNAAYWFRRVGRHRVFVPLAEHARPLIDQHADASLAARLLTPSGWNSSAMIDLCTSAARAVGSSQESLARRLQRLEMWLVLEATVAPLLEMSGPFRD